MIMAESATVTVLVSPELIKQLEEWSEPVQVKVIKTETSPTGYEMIARTPEERAR